MPRSRKGPTSATATAQRKLAAEKKIAAAKALQRRKAEQAERKKLAALKKKEVALSNQAKKKAAALKRDASTAAKQQLNTATPNIAPTTTTERDTTVPALETAPPLEKPLIEPPPLVEGTVDETPVKPLPEERPLDDTPPATQPKEVTGTAIDTLQPKITPPPLTDVASAPPPKAQSTTETSPVTISSPKSGSLKQPPSGVKGMTDEEMKKHNLQKKKNRKKRLPLSQKKKQTTEVDKTLSFTLRNFSEMEEFFEKFNAHGFSQLPLKDFVPIYPTDTIHKLGYLRKKYSPREERLADLRFKVDFGFYVTLMNKFEQVMP